MIRNWLQLLCTSFRIKWVKQGDLMLKKAADTARHWELVKMQNASAVDDATETTPMSQKAAVTAQPEKTNSQF